MRALRLSCICLLSSIIISSCVKQAFDAPPDTSGVDPNLAVSAGIRNLTDMAFALPQDQSRLLGDTVIYGIVIGDDRSGNIYKKIIIEDTSGAGIAVIIDKSDIYGDYPVGRKIYLKTSGLYLTNYKGVPEITYSVNADGTTNGIPSTLLNNFIVKASYPHTIKPAEISITDLFSNSHQYANTLVKLSNMQFETASANVPYSAPSSSTNRTITNCDHTAKLVMYNSSYATFQPALTPTGNGTIVGIITLYISTPEFTLRDTSDVRFTDARCP